MKPYRQPRSDSFKYAIHIRANVSITSIGRDEPMSDEELDAFRRLLNRQFADEAAAQGRVGDSELALRAALLAALAALAAALAHLLVEHLLARGLVVEHGDLGEEHREVVEDATEGREAK